MGPSCEGMRAPYHKRESRLAASKAPSPLGIDLGTIAHGNVRSSLVEAVTGR